ncbi:hypothetical protein [Sphingobium sp. CCH11-B1]|uniref:hypothetical protein n=1 Tax=Sphingobium sp. CCH11-B1 TaxID=1768781 RepID=UPI000A542D4F|nr:hypothetical protein [Sphingobium sp. CCH11-B1]MEA3390506.1 hypothetical protein [Pseudomonadota bacterium]
MTARFLEWIWHIKGSLALTPDQSADEALAKLGPLFNQSGTSYERRGDTLTFSKKDQAAQDKMSIFDGGVLRIEREPDGPVLRYHLTSRALLFCFLAPLLFLSFAGLTIAAGKFTSPPAEATSKKDDKKDKALPQHWIDKALGAPAPEKPKKDDKKKSDDKNPKPTPAYVFAGLFAALYVVGRILEDRLVRSLFRKRLLG